MQTTSRRTFVGSSAAALLGGLGVKRATGDDGDRYVEITTRIRRGGENTTRLVRKEWYDHVNHVENQSEQAKELLLPKEYVNHVGVTGADGYIGDLSKHQIVVGVDRSDARSSIPDQVNGVDVTTRVGHIEKASCSDSSTYYDKDYTPVDGGVVMGAEETGTCVGSVCCGVEWNGSKYYLFSRHTIDGLGDCPVDNIVGERIYQNGDDFAIVETDWLDHDAVIGYIDSASQRSTYENKIVSQSDEVNGLTTKDGIKTRCENDESGVEMRGINSGSGSGSYREYNLTAKYCEGTSYQGTVYDLISTTVPVGPGDSGGPVYEHDTTFDNIYMTGMTYGELNGYNYCVASYALNNQHGIFPGWA